MSASCAHLLLSILLNLSFRPLESHAICLLAPSIGPPRPFLQLVSVVQPDIKLASLHLAFLFLLPIALASRGLLAPALELISSEGRFVLPDWQRWYSTCLLWPWSHYIGVKTFYLRLNLQNPLFISG